MDEKTVFHIAAPLLLAGIGKAVGSCCFRFSQPHFLENRTPCYRPF